MDDLSLRLSTSGLTGKKEAYKLVMKKIWIGLVLGVAMATVQAEIRVSWVSNGVLQAEGMEPQSDCTFEWSDDLRNDFIPFTNNEGLVANTHGIGQMILPDFPNLAMASNNVGDLKVPCFSG